MKPVKDYLKMKRLNSKINNCLKCNLRKGEFKAVPGEGPLNAKIMVIGQNPGRNETITGRPFVGRAGKLLDKLLKIAKINRKKVFITSVTKCPTPGNRKPTKKEIQNCLPYLKKQIEIINPKKIILLGEVAFKVFFPKEKLGKLRGKWITIQQDQGKRKYFIAYHPAAGLRFLKIKKILEKDFKRLKI